jgi:hypothetical protein
MKLNYKFKVGDYVRQIKPSPYQKHDIGNKILKIIRVNHIYSIDIEGFPGCDPRRFVKVNTLREKLTLAKELIK